jgi:hypothetical protein
VQDKLDGHPDNTPNKRKRTRKVRPYPIDTLEDALAIARAIQESNAGLPFDRVLLAGVLGTTPASSGYTIKLNSAAKYGLTQGRYNDDRITLTPRGEAIVAPKRSDELEQALIEAAMQPEVFRRFYLTLDGKRLPEDPYAQNMIQRELGVDPELAGECLAIIKANGVYAGIINEAAGSLEVALKEAPTPGQVASPEASSIPPESDLSTRQFRIFVGESKNTEAVQLVKDVLDEFGIAHGASTRDSGDTQLVAAQVSSIMRECTAAVLVIFADDLSQDRDSAAADRVLYQAGAASAFYGKAIVVLSEVGLELPSDLRSLPNVAFDPSKTGDAAFGLLKELHRVDAIKVKS